MPSSTSTNNNPHSDPKQSTDTSQHPIQHQNTLGWLTAFILHLFQWFLLPMRVFVAAVTGLIYQREPLVVAKQLEGVQGPTFSGNNQFTNIGMNKGTVNNYGTTHGLEKLEKYVSFAALYDSSAQDPDRHCHPGTRENVLTRLRHWFDNPNTTDHIFWLHGPAGGGKSAIAQTIAHAYKKGEVAATFFFFRSDAARNDGNRLFPTIAWQLAFSIPATKEFILHALDKALETKGVETQFEQLVARLFDLTNNIASQMQHPAPVVIIDGLDECLDEQLQRRILDVIGNAVKDRRVPLRFIISSRPEALIEDALKQFQDITLRFDLATLDDSNRDIEKYLIDKFFVIASKQGLGPAWPGEEIVQEIVFKSSGNFTFASAAVRYISDEDCDPVTQLNIVRKLGSCGPTSTSLSPFALLDQLYLQILTQPKLDQDFLKTFLALLVGRSSVEGRNLHEDDATLMNVSERELRIKLRRMRSLLKLEPFIDVYHKSFLDFLQDSSRSHEYHVSKQDGLKRYLKLIVNSIVRHISMAIEQPDRHETCHSSPQFKSIVEKYPPKIVLPVEDWQEALKPLLDLQDKLLKTSKPQPCHVTQIMRELQLHLVILQESSHGTAVPAPESNDDDETITEWSPAPATEAMENIPEKDLDRCLSELLSCLQKTESVLAVDTVIIERMSSLLAFDHGETAARVRSVANARKLIDIVDSVTNNESFLSQCGRGAARKACLLASEIFARVPVLPQSLFLNGSIRLCDWLKEFMPLGGLEYPCSSAVINRILGYNFTFLEWVISKRGFVGRINGQQVVVAKRGEGASPLRFLAMLEVARTIRYFRSMGFDAVLNSVVGHSGTVIKIYGAFSWQSRGNPFVGPGTVLTYEFTISAFAHLLHGVCFTGLNENLPNRIIEDVKQLIIRCAAPDPTRRPTMEDVVKEMESWNLSDGDDEFDSVDELAGDDESDGDDENLSNHLVKDARQ